MLGDEENEVEDVEVFADEMMVSADMSSFNSLAGMTMPRSLRLTGRLGKHEIHVLIGGESMHNFIHPGIVSKLQLVVSSIPSFRVYVGNGDSMLCDKQCIAVTLDLQGTSFPIDLYVLQIHGHDVVLGVQWLQQLGRVAHNYASLTMEFSWRDKPVVLQGGTPMPKAVSLHSFQALHAAFDVSECYKLMYLGHTGIEGTTTPLGAEPPPPRITKVLDSFQQVFDLLTGLPPRRNADHRIFLQPGSQPANVRPYRYPHFQKAEIEKMVRR